MSRPCPVSADTHRYLAEQERAEADFEALVERFDALPAETRATLMWDFMDGKRKVAGKVWSAGPRVTVIETELTDAFMEWVAERVPA